MMVATLYFFGYSAMIEFWTAIYSFHVLLKARYGHTSSAKLSQSSQYHPFLPCLPPSSTKTGASQWTHTSTEASSSQFRHRPVVPWSLTFSVS